MRSAIIGFCFFFAWIDAAAHIPEKVLICGICKNVEKAVPNTIQSVRQIGEQFVDYRVIFYENNSTDQTVQLLKQWADKDAHVIFLSEQIDKKELAKEFRMKNYNRPEAISRARNKVLDVAMQEKYDGYKYVIWADLDFLEPWDVKNIVDTILHPEQEWDAVLANGAYDLFAFRDAQFPIGFELLGERYWKNLGKIDLHLDPKGSWRKVYSAFGGLGIYKRESMKGCRYSSIVNEELEREVAKWLAQGKDVCFAEDYRQLLASAPVIELAGDRIKGRKKLAEEIGVRLKNGKVVWFSCTGKKSLPFTCEHVTFHAAMIGRGRDKIFINPRLISNHPSSP